MRPPADTCERSVQRLYRRYLGGRLTARGLLAAAPQLTAGRILLGRSHQCHLVLADETVSRRHAELELVDGHWHLRDLGSKNGTWVNGRRVADTEVVPGDALHLGACQLRL
jgi:pSer/pThr/pTyr-binding forkhead associated (FHA) protein